MFHRRFTGINICTYKIELRIIIKRFFRKYSLVYAKLLELEFIFINFPQLQAQKFL